MEIHKISSLDGNRKELEEERAKFAEKQKILLEMKSKINRGKLNNVESVAEKTMNEFLRTCCVETEKEQKYVSKIIDRVSGSAKTTKDVLGTVNGHAQELLNNVNNEVVELATNIDRIKSDHSKLSSVLEARESRGHDLRGRQNITLLSSTQQVDRAEIIMNKILTRISSEIEQLESGLVERSDLASRLEEELLEATKEADLAEAALISYQAEKQSIDEQLLKAQADYDNLEAKLAITKKAMECAESDQFAFETEVTELRDTTKQLGILTSVKLNNIEENKAQISELSTSLDKLTASLRAAEADVQQLEQSLLEQREAVKNSNAEIIQTLENEVDTANRQLSADTIKADVMDNIFGIEVERSPEEWKTLIDNRKTVMYSNKDMIDRRNALISELESAKDELGKADENMKAALGDQNNAQSRLQMLKKRVEDERNGIEANIKLAESRITQANIEIEELTNSKCADAFTNPKCDDAFVTPVHHSSLQSVRSAPEASRALSGDSDAESVSKTIFDLPEGIVKRNVMTQPCSVVRSQERNSQNISGGEAEDGKSSGDNTITGMDKEDGDATMDGIQLGASAGQEELQGDKVEAWIQKTPENISSGSGTTAEMMGERYPENIFVALNDTDLTMDMDEDELNLSMMEMPPAQTVRTLSPPSVRQSESKKSIIASEFSDSDPDASVWGEDF
ncbi:hypothetical protein PMAYCL1PPCAC_31527 [Pristionchus mayeri]|uniref:Uncharacterized protein n=1 Tax=Pristionchus mayeri TaxID=1317129 RepID=A0AAN5ICN0_9BILA|nr:hypothetical protein PMAYCL1PPCAC_31527 [Pristionchus mayeri]